MDDMDEGLGDEVAPVDTAEDSHLQNKEIEYSLKPENCDMVESQEMAIPEGTPTTSFQILADMLEGKNVNGIVSPVDTSDNSCPRNVDDTGVMVEELTVRKCNSSNLPIIRKSNNIDRMQIRHDKWQHLYRLASGSGSGSSCGDRDYGHAKLGGWKDVGDTSINEFLAQKQLNDEFNVNMEQSTSDENDGILGNNLSYGSIRTKILSKSGFSEFFLKSNLKGKGIVCRGPPHNPYKEPRDLHDMKAVVGTTIPSDASLKATGAIMVASNVTQKPIGGIMVASNASVNRGTRTGVPSSCRIGGPSLCNSDHGVNLREWLKANRVEKIECLCIFRQIVELVDYYHTQGIALLDFRPSSFKLLQSNEVKYIGLFGRKEILETAKGQYISHSDNIRIRRRSADQKISPPGVVCSKKPKFNDNTSFLGRWPLFPSRSCIKVETKNGSDINVAGIHYSHNVTNENHTSTGYGIQSKSRSAIVSDTAQQHTAPVIEQLEEKWYASPEELGMGVCTISSNIYSLGVLLFELLGRFDAESAHTLAMSDLRHRILPPNFLSENPKEAGFCLWLLHPESLSRPTTREILQSEVANGLQEMNAEELLSSIDQDDSESELLLHFLSSLEELKRNHVSKLVEDISCLEADIVEVERRYGSASNHARESRYLSRKPSSLEVQLSPISDENDMRLMNNFRQLERAYFSGRSKIHLSNPDTTTRADIDVLRDCGIWYLAPQDEEMQNPTDCLGDFFDGLCKYARYSKFEVRGMLRTGEFSNSTNVICSLSFDRDEDHVAAAGVSKKIKIFEFNALFNDSVDIHYPVVEMSNRSYLSCICWNNYIKNYLASADYDGVIKLWDASTGQTVSRFIEHEKRTWSVDFSRVHPTKLASGSDDCSVKLWSINERNCLGTIRSNANVCCVQFSADSSHLLAFGAADYRTYCYDLRNASAPWCVLSGHDKTVSYVKFLDSGTLVTASTDNKLKLWDLKKTTLTGTSTSACSLTFSGHTNEKNFVGLSTADGYIACGSETNEVYAYHRSLPMPVTSYKFGFIDPISGKETDDDNGLFVSSVCWRGKSGMVVAANSSGCIKLLQMV